ncbi:MAG: glycoside hydrolase family 25 protein [Lachnospiraceae bacterium]|nr:glycoside hydrolase family 25 protein [Lachnospiraceae bacterium]
MSTEEIMDFDREPKKKRRVEEETPAPKSRKKKKNPLTAVTIFLSVITLLSLFLCLYLLKMYKDKTVTEETKTPAVSEATYTQEELDLKVMQATEEGRNLGSADVKDFIRDIITTRGAGLYEILRKLYPDEAVYSDATGYHFVPLSPAIPKNPVKDEGLMYAPNGEISYVLNGETRSVKGIDVSAFQGDIDWTKVAQSGVKFAFIRVGYRGYGSGAMVEDEKFRQNIEGALANGIDVGVYFFDQAINAAEALEEAQFVLERIAGYNITYPIAIDIETVDDKVARGMTISSAERTIICRTFCDAISNAGYKPMIYGNNYSFFAMLDMNQLSDVPMWYAFFNTYLYNPYQCGIWQYSSTGSVNGINGAVDMNIAFPLDAPF